MDTSSEDERELQRPRLMPVMGPKNARRLTRLPPEEEAGPSTLPERRPVRIKNASRTGLPGLDTLPRSGVRPKNARRPGDRYTTSTSSSSLSDESPRAPRPKNARTKRSRAGPSSAVERTVQNPPGPRRAFVDYDVAETHIVTPEEAARLERDVRVVRIKNKGGGLGVRTNRALPKGTYVGSLAGNVYKYKEWQRLVDRGSLSGKYGMDLPRKHVVDIEEPMDRPGTPVMQTIEEAVAHRINEPNPDEVTSAVWRLNGNVGGVADRMDVYTDRDLGKNQEILIHYGPHYHADMKEGDPGYYPAPSVEPKGAFRIRKGTDPRDLRWTRDLEDVPRLPSLGTESDEAAQRRLGRKRSVPNCVLGAVC